jgi:hypothetical protein
MIPIANCSTCIGPNFWSETSSKSGSLESCATHKSCKQCKNGNCYFVDVYGGSLTEKAFFASDIVAAGALFAKSKFGAIFEITMAFDEPQSSIDAGASAHHTRLRPWLQRDFIATLRNNDDSSSFFYPEGLWGSAYATLGHTGQQLFDAWRASSPALQNMFTTCLTAKGGSLYLGGEAFSKSCKSNNQILWRYKLSAVS